MIKHISYLVEPALACVEAQWEGGGERERERAEKGYEVQWAKNKCPPFFHGQQKENPGYEVVFRCEFILYLNFRAYFAQRFSLVVKQ